MGYRDIPHDHPKSTPLPFTSRSLEDVPGQKRTGEWVTWLTWAEEKGDLIVEVWAEVGREEDELEWLLGSEVASMSLVDPWMKDKILI